MRAAFIAPFGSVLNPTKELTSRNNIDYRGGSRIFEKGIHLRSTSNKRGGGQGGGPTLGQC